MILWQSAFHLLLMPGTGPGLDTLHPRCHHTVDVITGVALAALGLGLMHWKRHRP